MVYTHMSFMYIIGRSSGAERAEYPALAIARSAVIGNRTCVSPNRVVTRQYAHWDLLRGRAAVPCFRSGGARVGDRGVQQNWAVEKVQTSRIACGQPCKAYPTGHRVQLKIPLRVHYRSL
jgi:hypothetical protein